MTLFLTFLATIFDIVAIIQPLCERNVASGTRKSSQKAFQHFTLQVQKKDAELPAL